MLDSGRKDGRMRTMMYLSIAGLAVAAGLGLAFAGAIRVAREPRRISSGFVLLAAVTMLGAGSTMVIVRLFPNMPSRLGLIAVLAVPPAVIGIALLLNGIELMLREGVAPITSLPVVTSNFHVLRTAALTRRLGIDAQVLGARTAAYFLRAAFLREFVAVLAAHYRRSHITVAVSLLIVPVAVIALP